MSIVQKVSALCCALITVNTEEVCVIAKRVGKGRNATSRNRTAMEIVLHMELASMEHAPATPAGQDLPAIKSTAWIQLAPDMGPASPVSAIAKRAGKEQTAVLWTSRFTSASPVAQNMEPTT